MSLTKEQHAKEHAVPPFVVSMRGVGLADSLLGLGGWWGERSHCPSKVDITFKKGSGGHPLRVLEFCMAPCARVKLTL